MKHCSFDVKQQSLVHSNVEVFYKIYISRLQSVIFCPQLAIFHYFIIDFIYSFKSAFIVSDNLFS